MTRDKRLEPFERAHADFKVLREKMGKRVRAARRILDLTQGELAAAYGKTTGWVSSIEIGRAFAPPYLIEGLRVASGQPFGWFYGEGPDFPTAQE